MRYLDPKNDLTFYKVFGQHPDLVTSFLNALLPFESPEDEIHEVVEYLNPELVPATPMQKDSIVDVRCKDKRGRQFIVEMQMIWTDDYKQRVLFNASKAYVHQLETGKGYKFLQPVYSLNLVNGTFSQSTTYYHDYRIVEVAETREVIEGLRFIFVELPKFRARNYGEKRMQVLWLRYLTEINEKTREVAPELLADPAIQKALSQVEESAFTEAQLRGYDRYWDSVSTLRTLHSSAKEEGMKEGLQEGLKQGFEKGFEEGMEKGIQRRNLETAKKLKQLGVPDPTIAQATGLPMEEIQKLQ